MDERDEIGTKDERPPEERGSAPEGLDRDILVYRIVGFIGGLAALLVAATVASWLLFGDFRRALIREDPPPPLLPEARARMLPPEPRLQVSPIEDMAAYRAREEALLQSYGWADREASTARIPIDRAIDLYVDEGLRAALVEAPDGGAP